MQWHHTPNGAHDPEERVLEPRVSLFLAKPERGVLHARRRHPVEAGRLQRALALVLDAPASGLGL
eukprot:10010049-Alexandrium_andersonii.AAC.1